MIQGLGIGQVPGYSIGRKYSTTIHNHWLRAPISQQLGKMVFGPDTIDFLAQARVLLEAGFIGRTPRVSGGNTRRVVRVPK